MHRAQDRAQDTGETATVDLDELRRTDFAAYVHARAAMHVFDVIAADGERMRRNLTEGRRHSFSRREIMRAEDMRE